MAQKNQDHQTRKIFRPDQGNMFEKSYEEELEEQRKQQVECLGMTFENDDARREYFIGLLREKLKDPEFRKIEGFPIGEDEDILALSDPPYYTACPNPFIADFIKYYGKPYNPATDDYRRGPFAADVSEGKNDPIYNVHSYHTKVPHKAIMRYILHFTNPGDLVFDGFCGTGMTGVAARMCGDREVVMSLGYQVESDGTILQKEVDEDSKNVWRSFSKLGERRAILNDLSPAATFIAYNYNTPVDVVAFEKEALQILKEVEEKCDWMYKTKHSDGRTGIINHTIWSDVFICPECANEVIFWKEAVDEVAGKVKDDFPCPICQAKLSKKSLERAWLNVYKHSLRRSIKIAKQTPVVIDYSVGKKRFRKVPDDDDLILIKKISDIDLQSWYPNSEIKKGDKTSDPYRIGVHFIDDFYTKRNLICASVFCESAKSSRFMALLTAVTSDISKMARVKVGYYFKGGGGPFIPGLSGTLYIPSLSVEKRVSFALRNRLLTFSKAFLHGKDNLFPISTGSTSEIPHIADNSVDYLFIDPPFGSNIMYSELNILWESWLRIKTNTTPEAIENMTQNKRLDDYRQLMLSCFVEAYRVLKPGHWMTVEFSNTKASVWNSIQTSLSEAGFIIANVSALDKKQGSFNAVTNTTSVKQDLVISAYKPNGGFENRFHQEAQTEEGIWDFVRTHLKYLPVTKLQSTFLQFIPERDPRILFDQMVGYYVRKGYSVPISSQEFQSSLAQRFIERDGMYFLPDQVAEYDRKKMTTGDLVQMSMFVSDEASAIQWLKQQLTKKPQTFQDIHPQFLKEIGGWQKHEKALELSELLEQNFLRYDGKGEVLSPIHSYLSSNFKELRNLEKDDPVLKAKAKDRWYVPDPNKAGDLEKLRERALMREFEEYCEFKQKRLKVFRLEAVRAGFKKAWQERDYATIIAVARKIPDKILQEDPKLLMWYDQAVTRSGDV
ncbi:conserved hypothetical protein [delta proteobacterium NaphS2]|nr:conserved hypothetical protein [delta proteobacterium NaphS2]